MGWTLTALGPLSPASASYDTRAPSASVRKPLDWMALWWTKRSLPPSSGVMKPKPFSSLNHFTVPVAIAGSSTGVLCAADAEDAASNDLRPAPASPGREASWGLSPTLYARNAIRCHRAVLIGWRRRARVRPGGGARRRARG